MTLSSSQKFQEQVENYIAERKKEASANNGTYDKKGFYLKHARNGYVPKKAQELMRAEDKNGVMKTYYLVPDRYYSEKIVVKRVDEPQPPSISSKDQRPPSEEPFSIDAFGSAAAVREP